MDAAEDRGAVCAMNPSEAERQGVIIFHLWKHSREGWLVLTSSEQRPYDAVQEIGRCVAVNDFEAFAFFRDQGLIP